MTQLYPISLFATASAAPATGVKKTSSRGSKKQVAQQAIQYIMEHDKACYITNKSSQAEKIARIALDVGVKPEVIGAIIKQETHFSTNYKDMNKGRGTGPMQLVPITIHDMYIRPEAFDKSISEYVGPKKKYKTFEEALKAKNKNQNINLGKFGNKFFELYKKNITYFEKGYYKAKKIPQDILDQLRRTLSNNYELGVYLGCYTYKMKAQGASNEQKALERYNTCSSKYVREVSDTIAQVRKVYPQLK